MNLIVVPPAFIYAAWRDGAACLAESCETSGGEITGDQLKMILSRGERILVRIDEDGKTIGWGCVRIDALPNVRVMHITSLVCHNNNFQRFFDELEEMARNAGCIEIRYSAGPAQARLYRMKLKREIEQLYTTFRVKL